MMKVCSRCKLNKPKTEFYRDKRRKDGRYPLCKKCRAIDIKKYRSKPVIREKINESRRKLRIRLPGRHWKECGINMTPEEYNEKYVKQGGCCIICGIHQSKLTKRLCVDHNHDDGQCRSLVCVPCNTLIGVVEGKSDMLRKIKKYLKFWENKGVENGMPFECRDRRQLNICNSIA